MKKINAYWMESGKIVELGIDIKVPDLMSLGISGQGMLEFGRLSRRAGVTIVALRQPLRHVFHYRKSGSNGMRLL